MSTRKFNWMRVAMVLVGVIGALIALVVWLNVHGEDSLPSSPSPVDTSAAAIERGAYLARAGNCATCHTARGGKLYAGGRSIATPFGTVHASNLTPDAETGLGKWSSDDFWRALHNGRSKDGRLLYPAFPYQSYTLVSRADSDAIYAFLRTQPAVRRPNDAHELSFPYGYQASLAVWRALYFRPQTFVADATRNVEWNRGAYLVRGLGHCEVCHAPRNTLGATVSGIELSGGLIPMQNWYAPSLASAREGSVAGWSVDEIVQLLKAGKSPHASTIGPMAEVVFSSTQHLAESDLRSMATYLKQLSQTQSKPQGPFRRDAAMLSRGQRIYEASCAQCHGERGQGSGTFYPSLAGNRSVTMQSPVNLIHVVINGGFLPATAGNPRPFGMPPFGQAFDDADIAAVTTYIRQSWGNESPAVSELEVLRLR